MICRSVECREIVRSTDQQILKLSGKYERRDPLSAYSSALASDRFCTIATRSKCTTKRKPYTTQKKLKRPDRINQQDRQAKHKDQAGDQRHQGQAAAEFVGGFFPDQLQRFGISPGPQFEETPRLLPGTAAANILPLFPARAQPRAANRTNRHIARRQ
jgi:hypothetical protein